jgi:hypothetical protein
MGDSNFETIFPLGGDQSDPFELMIVKDPTGRYPFELQKCLEKAKRFVSNYAWIETEFIRYSEDPLVQKKYRDRGLRVTDVTPVPILYDADRPLSPNVMAALAMNADSVYVRVESSLFSAPWEGVLIDLIQERGVVWVYPSNEFIFTMHLERCGFPPKRIPLSERSAFVDSFQFVPITEEVLVFFEASGPSASDVSAFEGEEDAKGFRANFQGVTYISAKRGSHRAINVDLSIRHLWLTTVYSCPDPSLSQGSFYEKELGSFAVWSEPIHAPQIEVLVPQINTRWIIFPADGCGLGMRVCPDRAVSGDLYHCEMTRPGVKKETARETIERGLQLPGTKSIVFSYCQQFVSDQDMDWVLSLDVPLVFLEAGDAVRRRVKGLAAHGPCLFSRGFGVTFHVPVADRLSTPTNVLYSENLLNNGYVIRSWTEITEYLWTMRPFLPLKYDKSYKGPRLIPERGDPKYFLAMGLEDLEYGLDQDLPVYFYPTGNVVSSIVPLDVVTDITLAVRQPYISYDPDFSSFIRKQKRVLSWSPGPNKGLYFAWVMNDGDTISWIESSNLKAWRRTVRFARGEHNPDPIYFSDIPGKIKVWIRGAVLELKSDIDPGEICRLLKMPEEKLRLTSLLSSLKKGMVRSGKDG